MLEVEQAVLKREKQKGIKVVALMCLGIFLCMIDTTIMNITLPAIQMDIHESLDKMSWVLNAYTISIAVLSIPLGRVAEIYGKGKFYVLGLLIFGVGSALCAFATTGDALILSRFTQSIGAAILFPISMIIGVSAVPLEKRGIALGMLGVTQGFSAAIGPTIGGMITQYLNWTWVFWVNVPLCLLGIMACFFLLPLRNEPRVQVKIDWLGVIFSSISIFLMTLVLVKGDSWGWTSTLSWACYAVSFIALALFLFVESKVQNPMIRLELFKDRIFSGAAITTVMSNIFLIGVTVLLPTFLTRIQGKTEFKAALLVTPISAMIFIFAPMSSLIMRKIGAQFMIIAGFIVMAGAYLLLRDLNLDSQSSTIIGLSSMLGVGFGLIVGPMTEMGASNFEGELLTASQSVLSVLRQLGIVLAIAIFVSGLTHNLKVQENKVLEVAQSRIAQIDVDSSAKEQIFATFKQQMKQSSLQSSKSSTVQNHTGYVFPEAQRKALIDDNVASEMKKLPVAQRVASKEKITEAVTASVDLKINEITKEINQFASDIKPYSKKTMAEGFGNLYSSAVPFVALSSLLGLLFIGLRMKRDAL
ncbi:MFS transporter [Paenibacillus sp. sgz5001063]|uniref:MFS transporter n=1 Tax=Paenibacillus sp. sgz5001063 TaxID=3242474 RepID=UPI0036D2B632